MSGPITPPLEVTEVDGSPDGRPITKIVVSNGDLSISGRTATIDTTGSSTEPGAPALSIQYNSDPAGTFTGDAGFKMLTEGGGSTTAIAIGDVAYGGAVYAIKANTQDGALLISPEGTGQLTLTPNDDSGGTKTDMQVNVNGATATGEAFIRFSNLSAPTATVGIDGTNGHMILEADAADKQIQMKVNGTGGVLVKNQTTNNSTILTINGNGTGDSTIQLTNDSSSIELICDTNGKLKVKGGVNSFVFDASSATGGITWPDGTTQTTAASGGGGAHTFQVPSTVTGSSYGTIQSTYGQVYADVSSSARNLSDYDTPAAFPMIAQESGDISSLTVYVNTAEAGINALVGIYDDSNGAPNDLLGYATISTAATGYITQTSFSSTITLEAGTGYWIVFGNDDNTTSTAQLRRLTGARTFGIVDDSSYEYPWMGWTHSGAATSLPSTFSATAGRFFRPLCYYSVS